MPGALELLLVALVGGIAAVERKALVQSMMSRPIVVGPLVGWALGDPMAGLFVGAPLELLWSGAANLGAALPHHETAATAAIAAAAIVAGRSAPELAANEAALAGAAFAVLAPVALIGRRLEAIGERANELAVARATVAMGEGMASRGLGMHLAGIWRPLVAAGLSTALAAALFGPALAALLSAAPELVVTGLGVGWALVWAAGGACAVRAARLPPGPALGVGGALAALAVWVATLKWG